MSHLMLLTKTSETPLTETLESATEMLQTSVSGAAAGGVGRISWVIMILLTFLTLLSVIVLTLLQIDHCKIRKNNSKMQGKSKMM